MFQWPSCGSLIHAGSSTEAKMARRPGGPPTAACRLASARRLSSRSIGSYAGHGEGGGARWPCRCREKEV
eukprot:scaffold9153_cov122-Isochrysis_galbana.AAC.3